ncbi:MAG: response regulator [Desulfovibrionales bacterium]|nr:response regulator [Desulfovibrionales bacterium]
MADILIIDDDPVICDVLTKMMKQIDHGSRYALSGSHGVELARKGLFDLVFLDVNLPDANGLELIPQIKTLPSCPEVIIITGDNDPDGADLAVSCGAWNYLEKPFLRQEIVLQVKRALAYRREKGQTFRTGQLRRRGVVGEAPALKTCLDQANAAARSNAHVLISGEPGTGKKLFAHTVHLNSPQGDGAIVCVDCSAVTLDMIHAMVCKDSKGIHDCSQPIFGTVVLDGVEHLSISIQEALVRIFGAAIGPDPAKGCRFIATTRENPGQLCREDRLNAEFFSFFTDFHIHLPALRELKQDIITLAIHHMDLCCQRYHIESKGLSPEFLDILGQYHWPGNIQELNSAMDKAVASARNEPTLYSIHLPAHIRETFINRRRTRIEQTEVFGAGEFIPLKNHLAREEKRYLSNLWEYTRQNINLACEISGISRSTLYERLNKYRIR